MSTELTAGAKAIQVRALIEKKWQESIVKCLPRHVTPERMLRVINNALGKNTKLLDCSQQSLIGAIVVASELGLEPNTPLGFGWIIPYKNEAQFQIGYRGLIELATRTGKVQNIIAHTVHEQDEFSYSLGLCPDLKHTPALGERGESVGYYAVVFMKDGPPAFCYMSKEDVDAHALKYSKAYAYDVKNKVKSCPWSTDFDSMAKKTVIIQALKYCPRAIEDVNLRRAMEPGDAIDVTANIIDDEPVAPSKSDRRAELLDRAKAVVLKYADKVRGGVVLEDLETYIGGALRSASDSEIEEAITDLRERCELAIAITDQISDYNFDGRAMALTSDELNQRYADVLEAGKQ